MLEIKNLSVSYGAIEAVKDISLTVNDGEIVSLIGANGAGKTTLLRLIVGEQQPTSGSISYNGECTIGYLPQQMRVADTTTLVEETAKAFDEVLKLEAEIARLTREIAETHRLRIRPTTKSLLHRLKRSDRPLSHSGRRYPRSGHSRRRCSVWDSSAATSSVPRVEFSGGWRMRIVAGETAAAPAFDFPAGRADQSPGHRVDPVARGLPEKTTTARCCSSRTTAPFWIT